MSEHMLSLFEISVAVICGSLATYQYWKEKKMDKRPTA